LKALDELVHPDEGLASVFLGHCERFAKGIELTPLSWIHRGFRAGFNFASL
jgi:hypothetical protein